MARFVLVHGAWHGGWCWDRVAVPLRAAGHEVFTPTLTGLGERASLLTPEVGLGTHVADVVTLLTERDLNDVVLVGHSYSGFVVRAAADRVPHRVRRLVLVDAWAGNDGESLHDRAPERFVRAMRNKAARDGDGWRIPPLSAAQVGVTDPADAAWVESRVTPHPLKSFEEPTRLTGAVDKIECRAIVCTPGTGLPFATWARDFGWELTELPSGHDAMITTPNELAALLQAA
jgi:pimeloyl-ACP methyl ester carboxylesterase